MRLVFLSFLFLTSLSAFAWGPYPDEQLAHKAIDLVRSRNLLGACLYKNHDTVVRTAASPDLEWHLSLEEKQRLGPMLLNQKAEAAKQESGMDRFPMDFYLPGGNLTVEGMKGLPQTTSFQEAEPILAKALESNLTYLNAHLDPNAPKFVAPLSLDQVQKLGILPYRILQLYGASVKALQEGNLRVAFIALGALAHSIGSLTDPLQATGTAQDENLRSLWEESMWEGAAAALHVMPSNQLWSFAATDKDVEDSAKSLIGEPAKFPNLSRSDLLLRSYDELFQSVPLSSLLSQQYDSLKASLATQAPASTPIEGAFPLANLSVKTQETRVFKLAEQQLGRGAALFSETIESIYQEALKQHPEVDILLSGCEMIPFSADYVTWKYLPFATREESAAPTAPALSQAPTAKPAAKHPAPPELLSP